MLDSKITDGIWIDYEQATAPGASPETDPGVYNGPVVRGQREGFGTCRYPNGDFFKGQFVNGVRSGAGVCQFADGSIFSGMWEGDRSRHTTDRNLSWAKAGEWVAAQTQHINGTKQT